MTTPTRPPTSTKGVLIPPTQRTTLRRGRERGRFDRATINAILDEALVCNVSFTADARPAAIPMAYARIDDRLLLHGSTANRMMRALRDGIEACVTVTLLDGLVLARSAFHHSVNFRCVVLYAKAEEITAAEHKLAALEAMVEHVVPGRWRDVRPPSHDELGRTMILALPITEASAKLRSGPPLDNSKDYALATWAGEIPLRTRASEPVRDPVLADDVETPSYATRYVRPGW